MVAYLVDQYTYKYEDENGKIKNFQVQYRINLKGGKIEKIFNEHNHSIREKSEVFEFFSNKYKNGPI